MAVPTVATDIIQQDACDATTNFSSWGTDINKEALDNDIEIEGTGCVGLAVKSAAPNQTGFGITTGSAVNLSTNRVLMWVYVADRSFLSTGANYGLFIRICSSSTSWTTDYRDYIIGGSDYEWVTGGWRLIALDATRNPDRTSGTTTLTSIRRIGLGGDFQGTSSKSSVIAVDNIMTGTYVEITGVTSSSASHSFTASTQTITRSSGSFTSDGFEVGDSIEITGTVSNNGFFTLATVGTTTMTCVSGIVDESSVTSNIDGFINFQDIIDQDVSVSVDNWYGVVTRNRDGQYEINYDLRIGDQSGTGRTAFWTTAEQVIFTDQPLNCIINQSLKLELYEDTGNTSFISGFIIGSGENAVGYGGTTYSQRSTHFSQQAKIDFSASIDLFYFLGSTCLEVGRTIEFASNTNHLVLNNTFNSCGQVYPSTTFFRANTFTLNQGRLYESLDAAVADDGGVQTTETTGANNSTADDMTLTPAVPAVNDAYYFASDNMFKAIWINVTTAGSDHNLTWQYYNGSTWAALSNVSDGTTGFSVAGINAVTFDVPTGDTWQRTEINSTGELYHVRALIGTASGTQSKGGQAWVDEIGAALSWDTSIDIKRCNFIANAGSGYESRAIEHRAYLEPSYNDLYFAGNDYDVVNAVDGVWTDYYLTGDTGIAIRAGGTEGIGQSITGDGRYASYMAMYMRKVGTPTGIAYYKLYTHSGTFGTSSVPNTWMENSYPIDVSQIQTAWGWYIAGFLDNSLLVNTTKYVLTFEYDSGGDASNYIEVYYDTTTPTHGGNKSTYDGATWTPQSGHDTMFLIVTNAHCKISALGTSNPVYYINTGDPAGFTFISNDVTIQIKTVDKDNVAIGSVSAAIYKKADDTELMNEDTNAVTGIASDTYNWVSDTDVYWRVRESPAAGSRYKSQSGLGTITADGLNLVVIMEEDPLA
ncbi:MAG: hypothetical protein ACXADB_00510 [Candidatus Hermodarchaeia archaeon]